MRPVPEDALAVSRPGASGRLATIIVKKASDAARQILKDLMTNVEWKDDFIESYVQIGVDQGVQIGEERGVQRGAAARAADIAADVFKDTDQNQK
jgi:hypothetical protein